MKKRQVAHILLVTVMLGVGDQEIVLASQQATETTAAQPVQGQVQIHQSQGNTSQTMSGSASSSELGGDNSSHSSTNAAGLFGSDACRPEKIEITPCK